MFHKKKKNDFFFLRELKKSNFYPPTFCTEKKNVAIFAKWLDE